MRDKPDQDTTATAGGHDALGPGPTPGQTIDSAEAAVAHLLAGATNASHTARQAAAAVAQLVDRPVTGELGAAAVLADDLVVLGRATQILATEVARRAHAANVQDVTTTGVRPTLSRQGWTPAAVSRCLRVGAFLARYPQLAALLRSGCVTADGVLTIDHATRRLDASQRDRVVAWIV